MDFDDTPDEAAYRTQVREWLEANAPQRAKAIRQALTPEVLAQARAWQAKKASAGYAGIRRPREWGGGGGTTMQEIIFNQEEDRLGLAFNLFTVGLGMAAPTILEYADDDTKRLLVGPTLRGEKLWTQLFSEPSAGSDLAGLRTSAVRDGDDWVVNGQKVWNSYAHVADYGIIIVRTDGDAAKHKGLTMFWLPMDTPGVEVRPIHQLSGESDFCEVFFDNVRIPEAQRVGPLNGGWGVALTALTNERFTAMSTTRRPNWAEVLTLATALEGADGPAIQDAAFRDKLADWYAREQGIRMTRSRMLTALSKGQSPGSEASIGKVVVANQLNEIATMGTELEDQYGIISDPALAEQAGSFQQMFLYSPAARLGGGSDEINKNVIAERVLGMPR